MGFYTGTEILTRNKSGSLGMPRYTSTTVARAIVILLPMAPVAVKSMHRLHYPSPPYPPIIFVSG